MKDELETYRQLNDKKTIRIRLQGIPFSGSTLLFNSGTEYPCKLFGKQLVLHLVDALIECNIKREEAKRNGKE